MDFIVNETGVNNLMDSMQNNLVQIMGIVNEIHSQEGVLKSALNEDYDSIARTIQTIVGELNSAYQELNVIKSTTLEYMARVHQVRISLNS